MSDLMRLAAADSALATAPWWGTSVIAGLFLVIGGLIAFATSFVAKNRELARADRARWDEETLSGCVLIFDTIERAFADVPQQSGQGTILTAQRHLDEAAEDLARCQETSRRLDLVASKALSRQVRQLLNAVRMAQRAAREKRLDDYLDMRSEILHGHVAKLTELSRTELRAKR